MFKTTHSILVVVKYRGNPRGKI